jgi:hypothetical protein
MVNGKQAHRLFAASLFDGRRSSRWDDLRLRVIRLRLDDWRMERWIRHARKALRLSLHLALRPEQALLRVPIWLPALAWRALELSCRRRVRAGSFRAVR